METIKLRAKSRNILQTPDNTKYKHVDSLTTPINTDPQVKHAKAHPKSWAKKKTDIRDIYDYFGAGVGLRPRRPFRRPKPIIECIRLLPYPLLHRIGIPKINLNLDIQFA